MVSFSSGTGRWVGFINLSFLRARRTGKGRLKHTARSLMIADFRACLSAEVPVATGKNAASSLAAMPRDQARIWPKGIRGTSPVEEAQLAA
jgi:hypothetical protein